MCPLLLRAGFSQAQFILKHPFTTALGNHGAITVVAYIILEIRSRYGFQYGPKKGACFRRRVYSSNEGTDVPTRLIEAASQAGRSSGVSQNKGAPASISTSLLSLSG